MNTQEPEATLNDYILSGIQTEISLAKEARNLAIIIGKHSPTINSTIFNDLFRRLQEIFSERETLCVAKIFDRPSKKYPSRNISSILNLIEEKADLWSLPERSCLERKLAENGFKDCENLNTKDLSLQLVSFYRNDMPSVEKKESCELSASLEAVFQSRDKVHAHNEAISAEKRILPTWSDTQVLIEYAEEFIKTISLGFLELSEISMFSQVTLPHQFEVLLGIANLVNDDFKSHKHEFILEMRRRLEIVKE